MTSKEPPLDRDALAEVSASTVGHYQARAEDFWEGTRDHDVSQNRDALLRHLQTEGLSLIHI